MLERLEQLEAKLRLILSLPHIAEAIAAQQKEAAEVHAKALAAQEEERKRLSEREQADPLRESLTAQEAQELTPAPVNTSGPPDGFMSPTGQVPQEPHPTHGA